MAVVGLKQPGVVYQTDEPGDPRLRLIKCASKHHALPGEEVEFTLRFDNIGDQVIGNVTIIDNLTTRLEYVPNTAQEHRCGELLDGAERHGLERHAVGDQGAGQAGRRWRNAVQVSGEIMGKRPWNAGTVLAPGNLPCPAAGRIARIRLPNLPRRCRVLSRILMASTFRQIAACGSHPTTALSHNF